MAVGRLQFIAFFGRASLLSEPVGGCALSFFTSPGQIVGGGKLPQSTERTENLGDETLEQVALPYMVARLYHGTLSAVQGSFCCFDG